jgi:DNA mismatch repair protein MutL
MTGRKIKILAENVVNKIAAGEVVQRPESVVKELLENSIDASAQNIELHIKRAGKVLIHVIEDAILCIHKHATSKISSFEDLESIYTLGFRGEALSSIAAVSQLEIKTQTKEDEIGIHIRFENNELIKEKGSFTVGTSVAVKNLFYNVPARRNFLKSDSTELKHIIDTFNRIALSHPDISFKLFNDDELIFDYKLGSLEERIMQVFADNMLDALIPVEEYTEFANLYGYVGKPSMLKKSKGEQYFFLNNRYVLSRQVNHAVFTSYENILEKGDYPFYILFLDIDPHKTDVNIHPSKLEVRFDDEKNVYNFVLAIVKKSLASHDLVPSMMFTEVTKETEKLHVDNFRKLNREDFSDRPFIESSKSYTRLDFSDKEIDLLFSSISSEVAIAKSEDVEHPLEKTSATEIPHTPQVQTVETPGTETPFIFQLHNKYILSQIKSGLMIIDQHVAHERILYEKALKRFEADLPFSQQLLFPKKIEADPGTFSVMKEIEPYLKKLGFALKFSSKNILTIEGVPDDIKPGSEEKVLLEMIDEYTNNQRQKELETRDNIAKSYSCKTAIKAGDRLSENEMRLLIDHLFATSMPYVCPHGRPVVVKISLTEFDRRFGRT